MEEQVHNCMLSATRFPRASLIRDESVMKLPFLYKSFFEAQVFQSEDCWLIARVLLSRFVIILEGLLLGSPRASPDYLDPGNHTGPSPAPALEAFETDYRWYIWVLYLAGTLLSSCGGVLLLFYPLLVGACDSSTSSRW
jgi:hypothetical protein